MGSSEHIRKMSTSKTDRKPKPKSEIGFQSVFTSSLFPGFRFFHRHLDRKRKKPKPISLFGSVFDRFSMSTFFVHMFDVRRKDRVPRPCPKGLDPYGDVSQRWGGNPIG
jgi:hypothetical protein